MRFCQGACLLKSPCRFRQGYAAHTLGAANLQSWVSSCKHLHWMSWPSRKSATLKRQNTKKKLQVNFSFTINRNSCIFLVKIWWTVFSAVKNAKNLSTQPIPSTQGFFDLLQLFIKRCRIHFTYDLPSSRRLSFDAWRVWTGLGWGSQRPLFLPTASQLRLAFFRFKTCLGKTQRKWGHWKSASQWWKRASKTAHKEKYRLGIGRV